MRFQHLSLPTARIALAGAAMGALALGGCNGGGSNVLGPIGSFGPGGSNAQVRFVNGSPDAGPVQVSIDNQQQFCAAGASASGCTVGYGSVTGYAVNLSAGTHAIVLRDANGNQITIPTGSISVNSGFKYTIALEGEVHPSASGTALSVATIQEQPFATPGGGAAVNFNNAAPSYSKANGGTIAFGYYTNSTASAATQVGTAGLNGETNPSKGGIPSGALNVPIAFFAQSATAGITATPSQIDAANCSSNALPCSNNEQNLSLYLIDGPADSTAPVAGPYPGGATASATALMVGAFDPNG